MAFQSLGESLCSARRQGGDRLNSDRALHVSSQANNPSNNTMSTSVSAGHGNHKSKASKEIRSALNAILRFSCFSVFAIGLHGAAQAAGAGPSGRYYVTDESGYNKIWQFQGTTLSSFPTVPSGGADGPIIVDGNTNTVRSVKGGFTGGSNSQGSEYLFNGTPTTPLNLDFTSHSGYGRVVDAAFDGKNSYIVAGLFGSAGVFKYADDFSGTGSLVFNFSSDPILQSQQGITYDTTAKTLWTSDYNFTGTGIGYVRQWDMSGNQLSSFEVVTNTGVRSERNTALAYDFSDDTFWLNAHVEDSLGLGYGIGELWQFSRNGTFLQAIHGQELDPNAPAGILYWGGEIRATGQPAQVPGPLPALGVAAAFSFSRKLRHRIKRTSIV
jgi:hypothetical protein